MKKIFVLLGMLLLGIVSYAKEDDVLGTWLIKEKGKIVEIYKNENRKYTGKIKENNKYRGWKVYYRITPY